MLDEDNRDAALWNAIRSHNQNPGVDLILAYRVGDEGFPPRSTSDAGVLQFAIENGLVLISRDVTTLRTLHDSFVSTGVSTHGLLFLRKGFSIPEVVQYLALIGNYEHPTALADRCRFIPET